MFVFKWFLIFHKHVKEHHVIYLLSDWGAWVRVCVYGVCILCACV